jgi:hypothetical protein
MTDHDPPHTDRNARQATLPNVPLTRDGAARVRAGLAGRAG